ncbi:MAG: type I restriction-modification system subunit M [Treponema sp.]|jgi:type I restriction enzyme M protein|nr:type I restriction-modification system subunit M [Treponema sp.]
MADEYSKPPYKRDLGIPDKYTWEKLYLLSGAELENHYKKTLEALAKLGGILGEIFTGAQNKISEAAKLKRIVNMIGEVNWVSMSADVKGDIYERLLEKNAEDTKSGAGQYFTPRPLIKAMVTCLNPEPEKTIVDPACGTDGFFLAAYDYLSDTYQLNRKQLEYLKNKTFFGWEIVRHTYRLCLMNLFLHNIGNIDGQVPVTRNDALLSAPKETFNYVLTNPPFGKKSSMTFTNDEGEQEKEDLVYNRQDFWATGSNKQLNFVQHIHSILKIEGKAAVVVPDNVLFEGGAGETVRRKLLETTDLHTILRLPTGIFYKPGVKANVIFFDKKCASPNPWTKEVWVYDFRTNIHFTLKQNPLRFEDLQDFIKCYNPDNRHKRKETWSDKKPEGRFRVFTYKEILERDKTSFDIFWLKDKSLTDLDNLHEPDVLAVEIMENLETALEGFKTLMNNLDNQKPH